MNWKETMKRLMAERLKLQLINDSLLCTCDRDENGERTEAGTQFLIDKGYFERQERIRALARELNELRQRLNASLT